MAPSNGSNTVRSVISARFVVALTSVSLMAFLALPAIVKVAQARPQHRCAVMVRSLAGGRELRRLTNRGWTAGGRELGLCDDGACEASGREAGMQ
jgi:hypothetical protein